jgi:hypothetical protein
MPLKVAYKPSLLCDVTQRRLVVCYPRDRTVYILDESESLEKYFWSALPLKTRQPGCTDISLNSYHHRPTDISEEQRPQLHHGRSRTALKVKRLIDKWPCLDLQNSLLWSNKTYKFGSILIYASFINQVLLLLLLLLSSSSPLFESNLKSFITPFLQTFQTTIFDKIRTLPVWLLCRSSFMCEG